MNKNREQISIALSATNIELVYIEGGTFQMGGNGFDSEQPIHKVTVPSFYISKYQVTQKLYQELVGNNPSKFKGLLRPIETVSWNEAKAFIDKLNNRKELEKELRIFRLPTEAEWEYAARGGIYSQCYKFCGSDELKQVGWYKENSGNETKPVGLLQPNELGLFDMSGNVYEWCEDDYHKTYKDAPQDGGAWIDTPNRGAYRVVRGGYYLFQSVNCRPANRSNASPDSRHDFIGFRLACSFD